MCVCVKSKEFRRGGFELNRIADARPPFLRFSQFRVGSCASERAG